MFVKKRFFSFLAITATGGALFVAGYFLAALPERHITLAPDRPSGALIAESIPDPGPKSARLLFAGDIMLSRYVGKLIAHTGDPRFPFLKVAEELRSADIAFANLEGPISSRGKNQGSIYSFRADPVVVEGLAFAGFDVLALANNHIWDWGADALVDTLSLLENVGISAIGAGHDYEEAHAPKIVSAGDAKIAFLAYTNLVPRGYTSSASRPATAFLDVDIAATDIARARDEADIVVVSVHWGEEYETHHNEFQEVFARGFIDAGANLVVGHHPHVVQELERYRNGYIAYSLGNFVFDQDISKETMRGAALEVMLRGKEIESVRLLPIVLNNTFQPEFEDGS